MKYLTDPNVRDPIACLHETNWPAVTWWYRKGLGLLLKITVFSVLSREFPGAVIIRLLLADPL